MGELIIVGAFYGLVDVSWRIGAAIGVAMNKKVYGKYSRHNEIVTIRKGSDVK